MALEIGSFRPMLPRKTRKSIDYSHQKKFQEAQSLPSVLGITSRLCSPVCRAPGSVHFLLSHRQFAESEVLWAVKLSSFQELLNGHLAAYAYGEGDRNVSTNIAASGKTGEDLSNSAGEPAS
jgi:hypothetical protein